MIAFGILLEVLAAALGTTSKQLIAYSEHVHKRWIFHLGAAINIFVGPAVDASAYAFAPQVVIAPFACLDVIFNAFTAPYTLSWQHERLTRVHVLGTGLVALGAVFTIFGSVTDEVLSVYEMEVQLLKPASLLYLGIEFFLIVTINLCLKAKLLSAMARGICLGVIAGVLMGNVFCIKGFIGIVRTTIATGETEPWLRPTPYLLISAAGGGSVLGHVFMRKGLGEYKGIFMVTIFEGAHITAACLSGCVVMEELAHAPWWQYVFYWLSVLVVVAGMLLINTSAADSKLGRSFHVAQSFAEGETLESVPTALAAAGCGPAYEHPVSSQPLLQGARHRWSHDDCFERDLDVQGIECVRTKTPAERTGLKPLREWGAVVDALEISNNMYSPSGDPEANMRKEEAEMQDTRVCSFEKTRGFNLGP